MKPKQKPMNIKKSAWLGIDLAIYMALPSIEVVEQQFLTSVHSGVVNMWVFGEVLALIFLAIGIFLGANESRNYFKKLAKLTSKSRVIKYVPVLAIIGLIGMRLLYPALGESDITQNGNIGSSVLYQDGIHGNVYVNKTLGFKIERPDDTWIFMTDIPKLRQTYGLNPNPVGVLGGVVVGKSFTHESVSIWVLDPVAVRFTNMSDLINRTLTALLPVIHSQLYNIHVDISPQGDYGTYTYNSNYSNGIKLYYDVVIQKSNDKLYERQTLSNMSNALTEDQSIKFIIDHYEILN